MATPLSSTFHSFAYALVRRYSAAELYAGAAAAAVRARAGRRARASCSPATRPESVTWPDELRAALATRGFAARCARCSPAPASGPRPGASCAGSARPTAGPSWVAAGRVPARSTSTSSTARAPRLRRAGPPRRAARRAPERTAPSCGPGSRRVRRRVPGHRPRPGAAAAGARRRRPRPGRRRRPRPVDLRLPRRRGARHPRLPDARSRTPTAAPADVVALRHHAGGPGRGCCAPRAASPPARRCAGAIDADALRGLPPTRGRPGAARRRPGRGAAPSPPAAPRPSTSPTCCAARTSRTARLVGDGGAGPLRARLDPARCAGRSARPACRSRWPATSSPLAREPAVAPLLDAPAGGASTSATTDRATSTTSTRPRRGTAARPRWAASTPPTLRRLGPRAARRARRRRGRRPSDRRAELVRARWSRRAVGSSALRRRSTVASAAGKARGAGRAAARGRAPWLDAGGTAEEVLWALWPAPLAAPAARAPSTPAAARRGCAHRDLDAVSRCSRPPPAPRSSAATRRRAPSSRARRPADPRRHPRRARGPRRRRAAADRAPVQGPGVAARRRRRRAGGRLARPAAALARCCRPTGSAPTACVPPARPARRCSPRSDGCSTSPCTRARDGWSSPPSHSPEDDGEQPSRFLDRARRRRSSQRRRAGPRRPLTLAGLVAELRRTARRPGRAPTRCARRPPRAAGPAGGRRGRRPRRWCRSADPGAGGAPAPLTAPTSRSAPADEPVRALGQRADPARPCPARWFLEREAGGRRARPARPGLRQASSTRSPTGSAAASSPADAAAVDALMARVDAVWDSSPSARPGRRPASASEVAPASTGSSPGTTGPTPATVLGDRARRSRPRSTLARRRAGPAAGYADRLELDARGPGRRRRPQDRQVPRRPTGLPRHPQLGLYQLAVDHGAVDDARRATPGAAAPSCAAAAGLARPGSRCRRRRRSSPDADGRTPVERAARPTPSRRSAPRRSTARPGTHCDRCAFAALLPHPGRRDGAPLMRPPVDPIDASPADLRRVMATPTSRSATSSGRPITRAAGAGGRDRRRRLRARPR